MSAYNDQKPRPFTILLTSEEKQLLEQKAHSSGMSKAALIRQWIRYVPIEPQPMHKWINENVLE